MLYAGGCDTCYIQEVVIHVICRSCDIHYMQEVVIHVKYRSCDTCYTGGCDTC